MPPTSGVSVQDRDDLSVSRTLEKTVEHEKPFKVKLVWETIIVFGLLHIVSLWAVTLLPSAKIATILFAVFMYYFSALGITVAAHRFWSHRTFKANLPLQLLLIVMNSSAWVYTVFEWCKNHRVHHKFSDTNADPHNIHRGFFFSHVGWLLSRKHPDVKEKGKGVDLSDLYNDPILSFQRKYFTVVAPICCVLIPSAIPVYCWNESLKNAVFVCALLRWTLVLHAAFLVNSAAHTYGNKPFDKNIEPRDNFWISLPAVGEGWHNYHHTFPWDYRAAEYGGGTSISTLFIDFFASIGWAYDLKTASTEIIEKRVQRTGDGSH